MGRLVEIDEVELQNMGRLKQTVDTILRNPEAAKLVEQAHKLVNPNVQTPNLDRDKQIQEPMAAVTKEIADLRKQLADEKAEREKEAKLSALNAQVSKEKSQLRAKGWTEEGLKNLDTLMEQKGLLSPFDAAAIYERDNPPQQVATPSGSGNWNFLEGVQDGEADLKKLIDTRGESASLIDKMARDALNEVRGQRR